MKKVIYISTILSAIFTTSVIADEVNSYHGQRANAKAAFADFDSEFANSNKNPTMPVLTDSASKHDEPKSSPSNRIVPPSSVNKSPVHKEPVKTASISNPNADKKIMESSAGYDFTLLGCKKIQTAVECEFSIVDDEFDGKIKIYNNRNRPTTMIDNMANTYKSSSLFLKDKETNKRAVKVVTLRSLPTKLKLNFENFSAKATKIHSLDISAYNHRIRKYFSVKFRDITL